MNDSIRPAVHIRPEKGWLNDPNGIGFWDGKWHVMFQYNPASPHHDAISWGHVSSTDLVSWTEEPIALRPRPGTIDAAGVWSGVATIDAGGPVLVYTAVPDHAAGAGIALARRNNEGTWIPGNEWVVPPQTDAKIHEARDPFLFTFEGHRYGIQGAGTTEGLPVVFVYDADDLDNWRVLGTLITGTDPIAAEVGPANIWECPQLVCLTNELGQHQWVLIVSLWTQDENGAHSLDSVSAITGNLENTEDGPRFSATGGNRFDRGPDFYAPQLVAADDRVLCWGWSWESADREPSKIEDAGWAGILTLPRAVSVQNGEVICAPARELEALRGSEVSLASDGIVALRSFEVASSSAATLELMIGTRAETIWAAPEGTRDVRIFVDGSIIEAFADGAPSTVRAYPDGAPRWRLRTQGDATVWQLRTPRPIAVPN